jgi:hypothetical protein
MRLSAIACCGAVLLCAGTETYGEGELEDSSSLAADASASTGSLGELAVSLDSTNLPIVMITTGGQTIPYGTKITANMRIIDHAPGVRNHPTDPDAEYDGYIGIEVRGHFSATFPQQPYGLETRDASGDNLNVSLLGMPKENDWILTSNYDDKSLMRNLIAFDWFRAMGHYATRARLCEVMLNGEYRGIYVFCEKIKPDKNRVDISKMVTGDSTGVAVTGGYIISVDYYGTDDNWISSYPPLGYPDRQVHYDYVFPKPADIVPAQKTYIQHFIRDAEGSLYGPHFTDSSLGYHRYVDVPSFIDYFILSEVSRNVDGYKKSRFFYKDRDNKDSLLRAGPVWDFDWAWKDITEYIFANTDGSGWGYKTNDLNPSYAVPDWHKRLLQDGAFTNQLIARYQFLRTGLLSLATFNRYIDSVAASVNDAQQRHFALWPISAPNAAPEVEPPSHSYAEEVTRLKDWIARRIAWLDVNIPKLQDNITHPKDTSNIQIVNPSFELPGTGKVKGWDGVCADPNWTGLVYDIPGWSSDAPAFDSGVEQFGNATDGTWSAFLKGSDTSVYQITGHAIVATDDITMTADVCSTWGATLCELALFYLDNAGAKIPLAVGQDAVGSAMVNQSISFHAADHPACVGHTLGISFDNISPNGDSWVGIDNVKLFSNKLTAIAGTLTSPLVYSLTQNYPNPFNPTTEIRYQLSENSIVSLDIYDILGRRVAVLASGIMAAGDHTVAWNAQNAASGMYFARMVAADASGSQVYAKTIKLMLMK